ncbi:MAG: ParB/RepB/Spo0J family partition protein [Tissierellales bacterium]|nr:ParB/RepB/Spo0J family partition protein [Tissierellales bacterium]
MPDQQIFQVLKQISPNKINRNPENPRLFFRQEEMENLMISIAKKGIQVPIAVYQDGDKYILIDGERRWRCALKLNLNRIPALIQEKPTALENLLLMYNIHALREQWDYFTIASKLQRVINLFKEERGHIPNEAELSEETGLTRGQIRRCQLLMDLPERYQKILLKELELPKLQQKITEDFFIEMERSLKTITKRIPKFQKQVNTIRNVLIEKFRNGIIESVTDFRQLSKIATAVKNLGIEKRKAEETLDKVFTKGNDYGIRMAYENTVEFGYDEQKFFKQITSLNEYFDSILRENKQKELDKEFIDQLHKLFKRLKALLGE